MTYISYFIGKHFIISAQDNIIKTSSVYVSEEKQGIQNKIVIMINKGREDIGSKYK